MIEIDHLVVEANFQLANPFRTLDRNVLPLKSRDNLRTSNLILFIDGQPVETIVLNAKLNPSDLFRYGLLDSKGHIDVIPRCLLLGHPLPSGIPSRLAIGLQEGKQRGRSGSVENSIQIIFSMFSPERKVLFFRQFS